MNITTPFSDDILITLSILFLVLLNRELEFGFACDSCLLGSQAIYKKIGGRTRIHKILKERQRRQELDGCGKGSHKAAFNTNKMIRGGPNLFTYFLFLF